MSDNLTYSRLIQTALLIIEQDYMYIYGVDDIAQRLGVSKSHFIREFTKQVNITPLKYLTKVKLERSKVVLANEQLPIDLVASLVGFSCGNYFAKVFKKEYGISPTEFIKSSPIIIKSVKDDKMYL